MGKPKPFKRPSISISTDAQGHTAKKEWQDLDPRQVEVGDLILGEGLVVGLGEMIRTQDPAQFFFHYEMKNGTTLRVEGEIDWDAYSQSEHGVAFRRTVRAFSRIRG